MNEYEIHRGFRQEGSKDLIEAAQNVTRTIFKAVQGCDESKTAKEIQKQESEALKEWAEQNGLLLAHVYLTKQWIEDNDSLAGSEHQVIFDAKNNSVIKRKHILSSETYHGYLTRLELHNIISPAAPYTLIGFSDVPDAEGNIIFMPIVSQPVIKGRAGSFEEIDAHMHSMGLEGTGGRYKEVDEGILVHDLGEPNAIVDRDGNVVLIDPRIDRVGTEV